MASISFVVFAIVALCGVNAQTITTANGTMVMEMNGAVLTLSNRGSSAAPSVTNSWPGSSTSTTPSDTISLINMTNARMDTQFSFLQTWTTTQSAMMSSQAATIQQSVSSQQNAVNVLMSNANTVLSAQQSAVIGNMNTQQVAFNNQLLALQLAQTSESTAVAAHIVTSQSTLTSFSSNMMVTLASQQSFAFASMQSSLSSQQVSITQSLSYAIVTNNGRVDSLSSRLATLTATTTTPPTTTPSFITTCNTVSEGVFTLNPNPATVSSFQGYCANQASDANGYLLIAQVSQTTTYLWSTLPIGTGALGTNLRLTDAQINGVWNLGSAEKRLLIRCTGGVTWGSAIANNWYAGSFSSGFRSNCVPWNGHLFEYGSTIGGYGNGWYQQTGSGGCLHGRTENLGLGSAGYTCVGDVQFLIR